MGAVAVPRNVQNLLGKDGRDIPPGHAFSLYFPYWTARWEAARQEKGSALRDLRELPAGSRKFLHALADRQVDLAVARGARLRVAVATSPLATGLGMEHPVDNGFAFLSPYGLPYLAGSGVKGVMRRAAEELALGLADQPPARDLTGDDIALLFGRETEPACRGALVFWDVFPVADTMAVEVMTPHASDYYTGKVTPHDAAQPNPIPFLAVAAGAEFTFVVECRRALPEYLQGRWEAIVDRVFEHACNWVGFGAKTAIGYGALRPDSEREREKLEASEKRRQQDATISEAARQAAARQADLARMDPLDAQIQTMLDRRPDKQQSETSALIGFLKAGTWTGDDRKAVARRVEERMRAEGTWKEHTQKKSPEKDRDYKNTQLVQRWLRE